MGVKTIKLRSNIGVQNIEPTAQTGSTAECTYSVQDTPIIPKRLLLDYLNTMVCVCVSHVKAFVRRFRR